MQQTDKFSIALVCNATQDLNAGVAGVTHELARQFRAAGNLVSEKYLPMKFGKVLDRIDNFTRCRQVQSYARRLKPCILDVASGDGWLVGIGVNRPRLLIARSHGLEHIVHQAFMESVQLGQERKSRLYHIYHGGFRLWEVAQSMRRADGVFLLNNIDREFAVQELGIKRENTFIVDNGVYIDHTKQPPEIQPISKETEVRIAVVGSFIRRKGIDYLCPALDQLAQMYPNLCIGIFGTGLSEKETLGHFQRSTISRISVVPKYENRQIQALLSGYHIVIAASLAEGFGVATLEAMACGLAPIITDVSGIAERLTDGLNCIKIPARDPSAIVKASTRLIENPGLLNHLRSGALQTSQDYSWEKVANRQLEVYYELLKRRNGK